MSDYLQPVSPDPTPPHITPTTGDPSRPDVIGANETGTAPYDIAAPQDIAGISAAMDAAGSLAGAGVVYGHGPRQSESESLLTSPAGAPAMNVTAGYGPDSDTPNDLSPGATMENPIQGYGTYPGTMQDGVQTYSGDSGAMEGLTPEGGSMDSPGGNYPGTTQGGLPTYGT